MSISALLNPVETESSDPFNDLDDIVFCSFMRKPNDFPLKTIRNLMASFKKRQGAPSAVDESFGFHPDKGK